MTGEEILKQTKLLNLPPREYMIVGSGVLAVLELREAQDIDLLTTQKLYDNLKASGWKEEQHPDSEREWTISYGPFDAGTVWSVGDFDPDPLELIKTSDVISGIRFVNIPNLLAWKKACAREKDLRDVELIENYLSTQKS